MTNANLTDAVIRGARFYSTDISAAQLYSTASYKNGDLVGIGVNNSDLSGWEFAGKNLTRVDFSGSMLAGTRLCGANLSHVSFWECSLVNADMSGANLTGAVFPSPVIYGPDVLMAPIKNTNLTGADLRGAAVQFSTWWGPDQGAITANTIYPDGKIHGLNLLTPGDQLLIRNYHGDPARSIGPIPVVVNDGMTITGGSLSVVLDADAWDSTISFGAGVPVALGGTLDLEFAPGVDVSGQIGRTFKLFDWSGVAPTGTFTVDGGPYQWDLTNLYSTGEVTLTVPEPATLSLLALGGLALLRRRRQ